MGRRGFTVVEMLAVIAIVAVLAGIAFPVFASGRHRGDHVACAARLHGLGVAITLYANDHEGWVPPASTATRAYLASDSEIEARPGVLRAATAPYVKSEGVWFCPADR